MTEDGGGGSRRSSGGGDNYGKETGKIASLKFRVDAGASSVVLATADGGLLVGSETEITKGGLARLEQFAVAVGVDTAETVSESFVVGGVNGVFGSAVSASTKVEATSVSYSRETRADKGLSVQVGISLDPVVALGVVQTTRANSGTVEGRIGLTDRSV